MVYVCAWEKLKLLVNDKKILQEYLEDKTFDSETFDSETFDEALNYFQKLGFYK